MRSISALYRCACEDEGCVSNSELVKFFHGVDVALEVVTAAASGEAGEEGTTSEHDGSTRESWTSLLPPPPAITDTLLLSYSPSLSYPTHITLSRTYLGDSGAAAFFRVLPMLRWVRTIDARNVGAGPRAVEALCEALTSYLVEGCEEAAAVPSAASTSDTCEETPAAGGAATVSPLAAGRLPALELVDLRDNDAIFALSGLRLIAALKKRQAALMAWCIDKYGESPTWKDALPALEIYVDSAALPASTARAVDALNDAAAAVKRRRQLAESEHRWQERLRLFATARGSLDEESDAAWEAPSRVQPVGEHVVFRLPVCHDADSLASSSSVSAAASLRAAINAHMDDFLIAACSLCQDATPLKGARLVASLAQGARAALQVCVDFGADVLALLPHTNAALWYVMRAQQSLPAAGSTREEGATVQLHYWEAKANVAALLRGLQAAPQLERELAVSAPAGGVIVQHHLERLRELYAALPHPPTAGETRRAAHVQEMVDLYHRVVAALVTPRFSEQHLPSMRVCEQHIDNVMQYVVRHLVVGAEDAEALMELVRRLRVGGPLALASSRSSCTINSKSGPFVHSEDTSRVLPAVMARCFYHQQRCTAEEAAWLRAYEGGSATPPTEQAVCGKDEDAGTLPPALRALHTCHCAEVLRGQVHDGALGEEEQQQATSRSAEPLTRPCTTCCYRILEAVHGALNDAATHEDDELPLRWELLDPARQALPRELRMCLYDMLIRQRSRQRGGCAFLPVFQLPEVAACSDARWSMTGWLACSHDHERFATELLRMFGQWYRLRALESFGLAEAQQLLRTPD